MTTEHRFFRAPDGSVWTASAFARPYWARYLDVFDRLRVVARVCDVRKPPPRALRSDGDAVEFHALPYYVGPAQFARHAPSVFRALEQAVDETDAVIMRVPSVIASMLGRGLSRRRHRYGVEVVGDPYEVFAPGAVSHPLRPLFRWWFTLAQKRQCWNAMGAAYVTQNALQKRYPCRASQSAISDVEISEASISGLNRVFQASYSSVELGPDAFAPEARVLADIVPRVRLILVGSLEQYYKAPDIVITAVSQLVRAGHNPELVIVGEGKYRHDLEALAQRLGVADRVAFRGMLPAGQAVRDELDAADIFVLPSRTEGLPRAMIEAMARRLPCIGSTAGGIPELLPPEDMVPPGDAVALARKIQEVTSTPGRMQAMSERNFAKAHEYHEDILRQRRREFYTRIRLATEAWRASTARRT